MLVSQWVKLKQSSYEYQLICLLVLLPSWAQGPCDSSLLMSDCWSMWTDKDSGRTTQTERTAICEFPLARHWSAIDSEITYCQTFATAFVHIDSSWAIFSPLLIVPHGIIWLANTRDKQTWKCNSAICYLLPVPQRGFWLTLYSSSESVFQLRITVKCWLPPGILRV